jgi:hypothetical protein
MVPTIILTTLSKLGNNVSWCFRTYPSEKHADSPFSFVSLQPLPHPNPYLPLRSRNRRSTTNLTWFTNPSPLVDPPTWLRPRPRPTCESTPRVAPIGLARRCSSWLPVERPRDISTQARMQGCWPSDEAARQPASMAYQRLRKDYGQFPLSRFTLFSRTPDPNIAPTSKCIQRRSFFVPLP